MAKATRKGLLGRILGRSIKGDTDMSTDTPVVITGDVPDHDLPVEHRDDFMLLSRAINAADMIGVMANTRKAAMVGMSNLAESDPERMAEIITEAGAFGAGPLRKVIMELAGYGRARASS